MSGCRHATWTDVHHVTPRGSGGGHDPDNLTVLCSVHHAAVHRGALNIEGTYSTGFRFLHADGGRYGAPNDPQAARLLSEELVRPHVRAGIEITEPCGWRSAPHAR